ncbi:MAG: DUF6198 family protein [Eubacterium ventriosum]|uniref:DUF6198 family protein n=1 Tax=Eubacterium ventriosum TaxID=39496 RepID=UPI00300EAB66
MNNKSTNKKIIRGIIYITGLLTLALGIILNTKAGLGVSPIISVSYSISQIMKINFGNMTFILYGIFVVIEFILHMIINHRKKSKGQNYNLKKMLLMDALQFPLSFFFTRFMNLFSAYIPNFEEDMLGTMWGTMPVRVLVLLVAIVLTGVGAAMSLDMRIIPNPGDGIVQAISDFVGKDVGLVKNCFDVFNICLTTVMCLVFIGHIVGIGIGTVIAVIGVGRVIAAFNFVFMKKFVKLEIE